MSTPSPDMAQWPTQTEAAVILATNERTIRRWIDAGRLKSAVRPVAGRKPLVIVDPADVERVRVERQPPVLIRDVERDASGGSDVAPHSPSDVAPHSPDASGSLQPTGEIEHFVRVLETILKAREIAPPSPALVPHMTLKEAAEYSGLPAAYLVAGARAGTIRAVNVGTARREFWRFPKA